MKTVFGRRSDDQEDGEGAGRAEAADHEGERAGDEDAAEGDWDRGDETGGGPVGSLQEDVMPTGEEAMTESPFFMFGGGELSQADEQEDWRCCRCGKSLLVHRTVWRWTEDGQKRHDGECAA